MEQSAYIHNFLDQSPGSTNEDDEKMNPQLLMIASAK
jgi:hypothetical protein